MQLRRICALSGAVFVLLPVALAHAAAPAGVTVRVEGATQTLLPATAVTTTTAPVVKDGKPEDACPGTNAIGALELATGGNWSGTWFSGFGYSVEHILGESHAFLSGAFWDFWLGHRESAQGVCEAEVQAGDELLFFPCPESAKECATLAIEAPPGANVGEAVSVVVKRYNTSGVPSPQAGATLSYEGTQATTNENGLATVTPARAGTLALAASAPEIVRAEASICIHDGNDGTCGTSAPTSSPSAQGSSGEHRGNQSVPYRGPYAIVSRMTNVSEGHVYSRRSAPRLLEGTVVAHTAVSSVSIELHRSYRGRCSAFDGVLAEFRRARCGHGSFFAVSHGASFSYLLPAALGPGRYVLDSEATDAVGNRTTLARGTTRVVFYVR